MRGARLLQISSDLDCLRRAPTNMNLAIALAAKLNSRSAEVVEDGAVAGVVGKGAKYGTTLRVSMVGPQGGDGEGVDMVCCVCTVGKEERRGVDLRLMPTMQPSNPRVP